MPYLIETAIGNYLKSQQYTSAVEIGFGGKTVTAEILIDAGIPVLCTDVHAYPDSTVPSVVDDCFEPDLSLYTDTDLLYAIRPGIEIVPAIIQLAKKLNVDLIIYHLGFEVYLNGGECIDLGDIMLHRYVTKT
ncbi:MAG TPA: UPF0146 family protein [Methanocorpusculum sp.]|nr:UPF0146 family protein [Methanocorpusculum sp.]